MRANANEPDPAARKSFPRAAGAGCILGERCKLVAFAILILAPDLSFFAYLKGPRTGAVVYNIAHSWIGVVLVAVLGWAMSWPLCFAVALIWAVHIGVDRALGFGLKYGTGFQDTHLGRIGGK